MVPFNKGHVEILADIANPIELFHKIMPSCNEAGKKNSLVRKPRSIAEIMRSIAISVSSGYSLSHLTLGFLFCALDDSHHIPFVWLFFD
jgi:hypothetical protein